MSTTPDLRISSEVADELMGYLEAFMAASNKHQVPITVTLGMLAIATAYTTNTLKNKLESKAIEKFIGDLHND